MKLSETQKIIINLIKNDNYEIGFYFGLNGHPSCQQGGLGKGGKSVNIKSSTFFSLQDKGIIEKCDLQQKNLTLIRYQLTELGKTI